MIRQLQKPCFSFTGRQKQSHYITQLIHVHIHVYHKIRILIALPFKTKQNKTYFNKRNVGRKNVPPFLSKTKASQKVTYNYLNEELSEEPVQIHLNFKLQCRKQCILIFCHTLSRRIYFVVL